MAIPEKKPYEKLSDYLERSLPGELEAGKSRGKATAEIIAKYNTPPEKEMFAPFIWGYANNALAESGDADANAYISAVKTAGGSLSGAEETAIQDFYVGLKDDGIYSKLYTLYPFLGGVADSNKINALNPGTNDLTFNGTWTHSVSGSFAARNAANHADTGFNPSVSADLTSNYSLGVMNSERVFSGAGYSGAGDGSTNYAIVGFSSNNADNWYPNNRVVNTGGSTLFGSFALISRTGASSWYSAGLSSGSLASAGFVKQTQTTTYSTPFDANVYINAINRGGAGAGFADGGRFTFAHMGQGLSTTEGDALLVRVNDLQTVFGYNIFS